MKPEYLELATKLNATRQGYIHEVETWSGRSLTQGKPGAHRGFAFGIELDAGIEDALSGALLHELYRRIASLGVELQGLGLDVAEYAEPF
ncbi:hypothetical protein ASF49_08205 [Methylobacterium sp. Leaf104]|uniref:hypothetical protein n=1 Tax=Methylobacterium TaxID=407 RepID=UPI0006F8D865|nr:MULTISPECIES: hypothetical protein [Methylobacterium]KQP33840.1 hypothetical protein ASF49_08205 [Methylobacterium sp. Leaf104]MCI9879591.1 hypothetical protein [Methylobacterium goesingense]